MSRASVLILSKSQCETLFEFYNTMSSMIKDGGNKALPVELITKLQQLELDHKQLSEIQNFCAPTKPGEHVIIADIMTTCATKMEEFLKLMGDSDRTEIDLCGIGG